MLSHFDNTFPTARTARRGDARCGWKVRDNSVSSAKKKLPENTTLIYDSGKLSGVKSEEDGAH